MTYQQKITKPWGYELLLTPVNSPVTAKILHLQQGCRFSLQLHEAKEECLVLVHGQASIVTGPDLNNLQERSMQANQGYFIPKGTLHRCQAITDCDIFEASTKEVGTTVRLADDYRRGNESASERQRERRNKS